MSVFCTSSRVIQRQISLLFVNNIRKGLVFIWCSLNVILFQVKSLFIRSCSRFVSANQHQCSCLLSGEKMAEENSTIDNLNTKNGNFICGVVEGFYGRPWTTDQRKDLFQKMKKWGMDSYLYAPKDDYKHRAYWRELYTVEEAEHLTGLITAARESGVHFYYALSPGLDITYSSVKEIGALKRKLEQVSQFGCSAFALLFDDIEPEMSEADKEVFQSFAHAQVSVTNDIYQHLGQPRFIICPTQYCAARAMPNVANSEYLTTLGSKLAPDIDIMWTGNKVISRVVTVESIEEITDVLKRPPLIWDNLHANDYDQKRVFLGPYQGRSPDLIPKLRGVFTNPNCEFGANFIAIHTLAQWSRCNVDGKREINDMVSADIKLETETEDGGVGEDVPTSLPANMYHPRRALRNAIAEWLPEFSRVKQAWGPITKPQPALPLPLPLPVIIPSVNTCMSVTTTTNTTATATTAQNHNQLQALAEVCSTVNGNESLMQPVTTGQVVMNSLISESKVLSEPMDCNSTPNNSPAHIKVTPSHDVLMGDNNCSSGVLSNSSSMTMQVEQAAETPSERLRDVDKELTTEDLALMCDLFYLPFEHGSQGVHLLQEFNWLKSNAHLIALHKSKCSDKTPEVQEWHERAAKLEEISQLVNRLFKRMTFCCNRELLYDLYPYVWDMRGVISLLNSYIKWLASGHFPQMVTNFTLGNYTWFSKGWKESFMSGDQEPWVFRGGLTADLQRLIPVDAGSDLFVYKAPEVPCSKVYTVRPFLLEDEPAVYSVCRKTSTFSCDNLPDLIPDRMVGSYLTVSPELSFVVEDEVGLVGYAVAALDARQFYSKVRLAWLPEMCLKYPKPQSSVDKSSVEEEMVNWFHSPKFDDVPEAIHTQHPSVMCCSLLASVFDHSVAKRLVICLLAALRANGSFGVYVAVSTQDRPLIEFYSKLGFVELSQGASPDTLYLGRIF